MHRARARVDTERAERYLTQLCRHLDRMSGMSHGSSAGHRRRMPRVQRVDRTENEATVGFTEGSWTMRATEDALLVQVDAEDEDALRRLRDGVTTRLESMGRRDHLSVVWLEPTPSPVRLGEPAGNPKDGELASPGHRGRLGAAGVAMAALAVAAHLGLLGAAVAGSPWPDVGGGVIVLLVAVAIVTGHAAPGRFVAHRTHSRRAHHERG